MKPGNLQSAAGRMQEALEDLHVAWQLTRESWQDQQAELFEEKYLRKINEELAVVFPAIGQIAQTFGTASRDCEE